MAIVNSVRIGLPQIQIEFNSKAVTAVQRSAMGIVALILREETLKGKVFTIKSIDELGNDTFKQEVLENKEFSETNLDYIKKTLLGTPSKIVVVVLGTADKLEVALNKLASIKFNYLAFPGAEERQASEGVDKKTEVTDIVTWIKEKRAIGKTFKAVVANNKALSEGVINFTTGGLKEGTKSYTTQEYTCRIAGILAGMPFSRSSTYYLLPEITEITEHAEPDKDIDNGELILINDGENIKIGRGVNSFTEFTVDKSEDFAKIKVLEIMDMITDDIRDTFDDYYIGKVLNTYDNQVLFFTSVNAYLKTLALDDILDPSFENKVNVDVEAQRLAWEGVGVDTTEWDDLKVKSMSFRSKVFAAGRIKIVDAMEDLQFKISI